MKMQSLIVGNKGGGARYPLSNRLNFIVVDFSKVICKWDYCAAVDSLWPRKTIADAIVLHNNAIKLAEAHGIDVDSFADDASASAMGEIFRDKTVQGQQMLPSMPQLIPDLNHEIMHLSINSQKRVITCLADSLWELEDKKLLAIDILIHEMAEEQFHNIGNFLHMAYRMVMKAEDRDRRKVLQHDFEDDDDNNSAAALALEVDLHAELTRASQLHVIGRECATLTSILLRAMRRMRSELDADDINCTVGRRLIPLFATIAARRDLVSLLKTTSVGEVPRYTEEQRDANFQTLHNAVVKLGHRLASLAHLFLDGRFMSPSVAGLCVFLPSDMLYFWNKYRVLTGTFNAEAGERTIGTLKDSLKYHTMKRKSDNISMIDHQNAANLFLLQKSPGIATASMTLGKLDNEFELHHLPDDICSICEEGNCAANLDHYCSFCRTHILPLITAIDGFRNPATPDAALPISNGARPLSSPSPAASVIAHRQHLRSTIAKAGASVPLATALRRFDESAAAGAAIPTEGAAPPAEGVPTIAADTSQQPASVSAAPASLSAADATADATAADAHALTDAVSSTAAVRALTADDAAAAVAFSRARPKRPRRAAAPNINSSSQHRPATSPADTDDALQQPSASKKPRNARITAKP